MIPQYAHLSQPPPQLEGYVLYPVRGDDEDVGRAEDEEADMMEAAGGVGGMVREREAAWTPCSIRSSRILTTHRPACRSITSSTADTTITRLTRSEPVRRLPAHAATSAPAACARRAAGRAGRLLRTASSASGAWHGQARQLGRAQVRASGDAMISSPQVGVV